MIAMRDKLIDLITVGIVRYSVQQAAGNNPDMAAIIADVLIENDYCKASDVAREVIDDMRRRFKDEAFNPNNKFDFIIDVIDKVADELKQKYTEDNYDTDTEN